MKYNIYAGHKQLQSNLNQFKNQILNYFKSTYNDCFIPSFMNNKTETLNRNKHAGAHICVSSFEAQPNGFRRYNIPEYYYVTKSQVNIGNHYYFSLSKSVVKNATSNNKFMFLTPNSLFVCDKDFIIECFNKSKDMRRQLNNINDECFYIPVEDCEMIPYESSTYFGFYNASQWKPTAIGFYNGKVAANRFTLGNDHYVFNGHKELWDLIQSKGIAATFNLSEKTLQRQISKGVIHFVEGDVVVHMIEKKCERNTSYETISKRHILTDEEVQNKKEWEEFERKTIEELENKEKSSSRDVAEDNSKTQNVSNVIIKSNNIYNNNNISRFNNNIGHTVNRDVQSIVLDNIYQTWDSFSKSNEIWHLLNRRPTIKDFIDYKHNQLNIKEVA